MPTEIVRAMAQCVLEAQALLVGQHLMRGRLPDVDHRSAVKMVRLDEFGAHQSSPAG
jgi:hypothetical protein